MGNTQSSVVPTAQAFEQPTPEVGAASPVGTPTEKVPQEAQLPDDEPTAPMTGPKEMNSVGSYNDLHKKVKEMDVQQIEGASYSFSHGIPGLFQNNFQVSHNLLLAGENSTYRVAPVIVGPHINMYEAFPVFSGAASTKSIQGNLVHKFFNEQMLGRLTFQTKGISPLYLESNLDYHVAEHTTLSGQAVKVLAQQLTVLQAQVMQGITKNLSIGILGSYKMHAKGAGFDYGFGAQYQAPSYSLAATYGAEAITLSFIRKASPNVDVGVECQATPTNGESLTSFKYAFNCPKQHWSMRGNVDTAWNIASSFKKSSPNLPIELELTQGYNLKSHKHTLGFGLKIGN